MAAQGLMIFEELAKLNVRSFSDSLEAERACRFVVFDPLCNTGNCYFARFILALDTSDNHPLGDFKRLKGV